MEAATTELPPVVVMGGGGGGAANPNPPAPGAQPAAPGAVGALPQVDPGAADPADVAADAGVDPADAVEEIEVGGNDVIVPVEVDARPKPAPAPVLVDGGGTGGGAPATPDTAGPPLATPTGTLPFTGIGETILLIALAGMLVPIGVLLYCAARRGDLNLLRRQLAMPRFQWADPRERPYQQVQRSQQARIAPPRGCGPLPWPGD
jgi:hypothetical protein